MKVSFKELGYVKNAQLDLDKDLIVLCGPNNTGKTYVAYAIYGLMKYRSKLPKTKKIVDILNNLIEKGNVEFNIFELLTEYNSEFLNSIGDNYVKQLYQVFASSTTAFAKTEIKIELGEITDLKSKILDKKIRQEISIRNSVSIQIVKEVNSLTVSCFLIDNDNKDVTSKNDLPTEVVLGILSDRILNIIIDFIFPNTYIAPAERIAINIFSKELSIKRNILVDKLLELNEVGKIDDPFDLVNRRATRYPLPIRDSLETSEDLNNFKRNKSEFEYFADDIEKEILKGQVLISKDGDVQFSPDKAKSLKLPIHLTASVVKTLSNLVIYFRHLAKKGDFIIIDEPELNLHPDNQIIIARILAKIVNNGFKLLISTHSDYIIRELNNLIMLNQNPKLVEKYKPNEDTLLSHKNIQALLFHYNTRKIINLEVNETGFEVDTIDEVINQLNERSQDLYFSSNIEK